MFEKVYIWGTMAVAVFVGYVGRTSLGRGQHELGMVLTLFAAAILLFLLVQLVVDRVLPKDED